MSTAAPPAASAAPSVSPTFRQLALRGRTIAISAAILALLLLVGLVVGGSGASTGELAPDNAGPRGGRAIAEVLRHQGVQVTVTDSPRAARRAARGAVLLVDDASQLLAQRQWRALLASADRLVVLSPGYDAIAVALPAARAAGVTTAGTVAAGCADARARRAGSMATTATTLSLRLERGADARLCFARSGAGQLVSGRTGTTDVTLLAGPEPFENQRITRAGNASVALNVLGARSRLIWLRPGIAESARGAEPTLATLTPPWVTPFMILLLAAAVAAAFWRGRRLGPLVVERLPVVVRSRETVEGRARLYARAGARLRAADALRMGTIGRLVPLLGLSRLASVDDVVHSVAARTGRPLDAVRSVLLGAEPASDGALVGLSDDLARLEQAVQSATALPADPPRTTGAP